MTKVIGRFIPTGAPDYRQPFNVLTIEPSHYLAPAWHGKKEDGEEYHVIERAWKFEPAWSGEGLPPVGCECELSTAVEFYTHSGSFDFEEGTVVIVGGTVNFGLGDFVAVKVRGSNCITEINPTFLRPIRSEADKKRDEVGLALYHAINWNAEGELVSPSRMEDYKKSIRRHRRREDTQRETLGLIRSTCNNVAIMLQGWKT